MDKSSTNKNIKLSDVARLAGCATGTASRALSRPDMVSKDVIKRVQAAVEKLGYTPNNAAKSLRSRRSNLIGIVIPTIDHSIFAQAVNALENRLSQLGYSLLVTTSQFDLKRELQQTQMLVERGSEGVVLVGRMHDPELYEFLRIRGIPYINTYAYRPSEGHPFVGFDNSKATAQIAEYLFTLGHADIGVISGATKDNDRATDRVAGVKEAYRARGKELPPDRITEQPYTISGGREGLRYLLSKGKRPTAVVCSSDILAFGALSECNALGLHVPEDISIIGFDDHELAAHLRLTTMQVPAVEIGQRAAEYLVAKLNGDPVPDHAELEVRLIARGTAGPPSRKTASARTEKAR
ncbi:LacI family DNA-binding transcriptional regulator [Paraburkholderia sabiae]|uniref:LacI family DNA-binding transcriptional regulator n=1 Tax=Paraburkholderia sabiae TaxID=273251 RepID=A0ABU9QHY6_9BURK|nr:LacI family DNA-binding transcriptional regulator [Paraburkholderia sabiae]WJZ77440.1 LacI family DNA-binding transcriptional regulator [Paraburkholderia sabiae]